MEEELNDLDKLSDVDQDNYQSITDKREDPDLDVGDLLGIKKSKKKDKASTKQLA